MLIAQLCLILCNPMDCWAPLSMEFSWQEHWSVLAILAILFSRGAYQPRDWTWVSCIAGEFFSLWATRLPTGHSRLPQTSVFFSFYSPCQITSPYSPTWSQLASSVKAPQVLQVNFLDLSNISLCSWIIFFCINYFIELYLFTCLSH